MVFQAVLYNQLCFFINTLKTEKIAEILQTSFSDYFLERKLVYLNSNAELWNGLASRRQQAMTWTECMKPFGIARPHWVKLDKFLPLLLDILPICKETENKIKKHISTICILCLIYKCQWLLICASKLSATIPVSFTCWCFVEGFSPFVCCLFFNNFLLYMFLCMCMFIRLLKPACAWCLGRSRTQRVPRCPWWRIRGQGHWTTGRPKVMETQVGQGDWICFSIITISMAWQKTANV